MQKEIKIFTIKQQFPCGPGSGCCGPIGQSEEEINNLIDSIKKIGIDSVMVNYVNDIRELNKFKNVQTIFTTFGPGAAPVILLDNDIISIGKSGINNIISLIKNKL